MDEIELEALAPGDVLIRLGASGLCHTDLEVIEGELAYPLPIVLSGHEGARLQYAERILSSCPIDPNAGDAIAAVKRIGVERGVCRVMD